MKALNRLLFDDELGFRGTYAHALELEAINRAIREVLPDEAQAFFIGAALQNTTLSLVLGSAAWAQNLRFHLPAIAAHLARHQLVPPETQLRLKVTPQSTPKPFKSAKPSRPSSQTLEAMQSVVQTWEKNSALTGAMEKLLKQLSSSQN